MSDSVSKNKHVVGLRSCDKIPLFMLGNYTQLTRCYAIHQNFQVTLDGTPLLIHSNNKFDFFTPQASKKVKYRHCSENSLCQDKIIWGERSFLKSHEGDRETNNVV